MKFTKEEIDLCKQIAERYRKEIGLGDWFLSPETGDVEFLCQYGYGERNVFIPLWTISDCLEFLRKRGWFFCLKDFGDINHVGLWKGQTEVPQMFMFAEVAKTPLEALLKAVLAVLVEK